MPCFKNQVKHTRSRKKWSFSTWNSGWRNVMPLKNNNYWYYTLILQTFSLQIRHIEVFDITNQFPQSLGTLLKQGSTVSGIQTNYRFLSPPGVSGFALRMLDPLLMRMVTNLFIHLSCFCSTEIPVFQGILWNVVCWRQLSLSAVFCFIH